jgi:hypothetical protein
MRNATRALVAITIGFLACTARPASALELISNVSFDKGLGGWQWCCAAPGKVTWDATRDAFGSALSGSARIAHNDSYGGSPNVLFVTQCLTDASIQPGAKLFFGAKVRFEAGEPTPGQAYMSIEFRSSADCASGELGGAFKALEADDQPRGTWARIKRGPGVGVTVPEGTQSVKVFVVLSKKGPGTLTANVDDVYVAPVGTPICGELPATIVGTAASEIINGTAASDVIVGRGGADAIDGKGGNDRICGGPGNDTLYGGDGDDRLFGQGGQDELWGGKGNDVLSGDGNNDVLHGGPGDDKLRGGTGVDTCYGDAGATVKKNCELPFKLPF